MQRLRQRQRARSPQYGAITGLVLLAGAVLGVASIGRAQEPPPDPGELDVSVNYVYAAQLGFGTYRVGGLTVNVYSLPIVFDLGDVLFDAWDLELGLPVLFGDYEFKGDVVVEGVPLRVKAEQKTLSFEPKLKLEIPVLEPWTVSLIGAWGFGSSFSSSARARAPDGSVEKGTLPDAWYYTYQVGISSLLSHRFGRWTLGLGNAFVYAGNATLERDRNVEAYGALETGVEARHPLGFEIEQIAADAGLYFIHYFFTPSLEFTRVQRASLEVDNLYEVGLTFGADQETPLHLPLFGNPRVGVSYRFGEDLDAVRLNFGFPF